MNSIGIVTPSWNQAAFIEECLASVRREAELLPPDWQVTHHVQDAASTDSTTNILKSQTFATWESRPDRGQASAVNIGWAVLHTDILAFLCADDFYEEGALRRAAAVFATHPTVDVVYGDYFFLEGDSAWKRRKIAGPWSVARLHKGNFVSQPTVFIRRRVYERFAGLDESLKYCLDHEYWLRIAPHTQWFYLPEPQATMRLHGDAKTASRLTAMWWESARMQRRYGIRWRPFLAALNMQIWGCHYYHLKRKLFQMRGRRRTDKSQGLP